MNPTTHTYRYTEPFSLESGKSIQGFHLAYTTYGKLSEKKDNVVWIFQALTANSNPAEWWPGMVGEGKFFDPNKYFIICVNTPGSCYGSIGPLDINPETNKPFYKTFPFFTPADMARAYMHLQKELGIEKIYLGIGGSVGGQQLLSWACMKPSLFEYMVPIATNAFHSPWGKAFNASQRMSIEADHSWAMDHPDAGKEGLKVARSIALISYRHYDAYGSTQQDSKDVIEHTRSESYQKYQGEKLANRFNAYSYYTLTKSMDAHHLGRGVLEAEELLSKIQSKTVVIGIGSDLLFPISEQKFLAAHIPGATYKVIESIYGHDGFLLEDDQITAILEQLTAKNI